MDLGGNIPSAIIHGEIHNVTILDRSIFEPGAFDISDRGYLNFARANQSSVIFVTRTKRNFRFKRLYSRPVRKSAGVQSNQIIALVRFYAKMDYPEKLGCTRYFNADQNKHLVFLTNNFTLPELTMAQLYQCLWQTEIFFKSIKQHLRIKAFYGTGEKVIITQIWIVTAVNLLVAIVKKQLHLDLGLYTILQILSVTLFEKTPILGAPSIIQPQEVKD